MSPVNVIAVTDCYADVIFVVDESSSVQSDNFQRVKSFLWALVGRLDIDNGDVRVGLVTYSTVVDTAEAFNLNAHSSVTDVRLAILSLSYSIGSTNTHLVLRYVRTTMLTPAAGDRPDVPNVVAVVTDGQSTSPTLTQVCTT